MTTSGQRFRRRAFRRGYKVDEVDAFLDRVEATLAGGPVDTPVTAQEVRDVEFSVRFGGYDEWQVDLHLDRLERQLAEMAERGTLPGPREAHGVGQPPVSPVPHRPSPTPAGMGRFGQPEPPPPPRYDEPTFAGQYDHAAAYSQDLTTEMHIGALGAPEWARPPGAGAPVAGPPGPPGPGAPSAGPHTAGAGPHTAGGHPAASPQVGRPSGPPPHLGVPVMGPPPPPPMGTPGVVGPPPPAGHMTPGMGGVPAGDVQRVDELRRSFQPRRFGSGYDRAQVDELFERVMAGMTGRAPLSVSEADLDPRRFDLVPGGYFEADVDNALREVREIIRRL